MTAVEHYVSKKDGLTYWHAKAGNRKIIADGCTGYRSLSFSEGAAYGALLAMANGRVALYRGWDGKVYWHAWRMIPGSLGASNAKPRMLADSGQGYTTCRWARHGLGLAFEALKADALDSASADKWHTVNALALPHVPCP